jgi:serine/threonine-protein kinase
MYEQFAAGGMATLHYGRLAGSAGFSRTVAVKRLHAHLSEDPDFVAMFLDEARLAARIHHPNVIQTLDVESSEGELFVVLDYVHGDSLSRLQREARRTGDVPAHSVVGAILFGVLQGLHAAHEARDANGQPLDLVHRDVSPHNVLIGTDGVARVLDFGVAKARGRAQTTRHGQLKGKLAYMAPEQLRGTVSRRSDIFSASIVLWEALAGTRLFQGDDEGAIIDRLMLAPIPSPRSVSPSVSSALEAVVMRGLERDPDKRFQTAREMAVALERECELATPIEVGAWVERVAGATLAQRAERVASIEADGGTSATASGTSRSPARPPAPSVTGVTPPTLAVTGLALVAPPPAMEPSSPDATKTGVASVTDAQAPTRRSRFPLLRRPARLAATLLALIAGVVLGFSLRSGGSPAAATPASPSTSASTSDSVSPPREVPPPLEEAAQATPPPSGVVVEPRPPETPWKRSPPPPARKRAACSPPYTIDARGVRHYKPECL